MAENADSIGRAIARYITQRQELRKALPELLLHMHQDPQGQAIPADGQIARFVYVEDGDYDAIRSMARQAELVTL